MKNFLSVLAPTVALSLPALVATALWFTLIH
jgi:hypothetical protein